MARNTYDSTTHRVIEQLDAFDHAIAFAWNASTQTATMTDSAGLNWQDAYLGNALFKRIDPLNNTTRYDWDAKGNLLKLTDPRGNATVMTYDASGNLLTSTAPPPLSYQESWTYTALNDVRTHTNARGKTTTYDYDASGNLTKVTEPDPDGTGPLTQPITVYNRDPAGSGLLASIDDPRSKRTLYDYGSLGNLIAVTTPLGNKTSFGYDSAGRVTSVVEPRGNVLGCGCAAQYTTSFSYDAAGHRLSEQDALGNRTTYSYDDVGNPKTVKRAVGTLREQTWSYDYNAANERVQETAPGGLVTLAEYGPRGRLTKVTAPDPDGPGPLTAPVTTYSYDAAMRLQSMVGPRGNLAGANPSQFTWTYGYDANGNATSVQDPFGDRVTDAFDVLDRKTSTTVFAADLNQSRLTTFAYDENGNLTSASGPDPDGPGPLGPSVLGYGYDFLDRLTSTTDPRGKTTTYAYDVAGNRTAVTSQLGNKTTYSYNDDGRLSTVVDPRGNVSGADAALYRTVYGYDAAGNVLSVSDPLSHATSYVYDRVGRRTSRTDANQHTVASAYDELGRLTKVTGADLKDTNYSYDSAGNLATRTDAKQRATTYGYDALHRLTSVTTPLGKQLSYAYDVAGNLVKRVDGNGNATAADPNDGTTVYTHDALDRLAAVDYSDLTPDVAFGYDGFGARTFMTDGAGTESYAYDGAGRLTRIMRGADTLAYGYDAADNLSRRTYPDGTVADYGFDDDERLQSVTSGGATTAYGYDAADNLTSTTLPAANGYVETRAYDNAGDLSLVKNAKGTSVLSQYAITRDPVGNPTRVDRSGAIGSAIETYKYDAADRITEDCFKAACTKNNDPYIRWLYDGVGNRTTETRSNGTTTYSYDADDRLTGRSGLGGTVNYSYDSGGQETAAGSRTFAWDLAGRVKSSTSGSTTVSYGYDGDGKRSSSTVGSTTTKPFWDPSFDNPQLLLERDGGGGLVRRYLVGSDTVSLTTPVGSFYYSYDADGSVSNLTSSAGATQWTYAYEPFGPKRTETKNVPSAPANQLQYSGEYLDSTTSLYNLRARQYDPGVARMLSTDPVAPSIDDPYVSAYAYANQRPTVLADPSGMFGCGVFSGICDAAKTVASGAVSVGRFAVESVVSPFVASYNCINALVDYDMRGATRSCVKAAVGLGSFYIGGVIGRFAVRGLTLAAERVFDGLADRELGAAFARTVSRFVHDQRGELNFGGFKRGSTLTAAKAADDVRLVPNPWGRLGSPAHRARITEAESRLAGRGWNTVAGGSLPERRFGSRFPDLVMERDGRLIAFQVGRTTGSGLPIARERRALADLRASGEFEHVFFLPFGP